MTSFPCGVAGVEYIRISSLQSIGSVQTDELQENNGTILQEFLFFFFIEPASYTDCQN